LKRCYDNYGFLAAHTACVVSCMSWYDWHWVGVAACSGNNGRAAPACGALDRGFRCRDRVLPWQLFRKASVWCQGCVDRPEPSTGAGGGFGGVHVHDDVGSSAGAA